MFLTQNFYFILSFATNCSDSFYPLLVGHSITNGHSLGFFVGNVIPVWMVDIADIVFSSIFFLDNVSDFIWYSKVTHYLVHFDVIHVRNSHIVLKQSFFNILVFFCCFPPSNSLSLSLSLSLSHSYWNY